jgi:hypothetical protein
MNRAEFLKQSASFEVWVFENIGEVICFTFYRSPEEQLVEFNAGRSRVKSGKHQQWKAKDYAVWDDVDADGNVDKDELRFNDDPHYLAMGEEWERRGGIWGGRWKDPHDPYHFEG